MAEGGDKNAVRILGIDQDRSNLLCVAQRAIPLTQMLPGEARVVGLVDTVAYREIGTTQAFTTTDIDRIRIRRRDRQRSNRTGGVVILGLTIEDRIPGAAGIRRLPNPAVVRRHVEDIRLARNTGNRHGAAAAKRADHAPVKFLVHRRVIRLGGKRERKEQNAERGERNPQESLVHGCPRRELRINHGSGHWTARGPVPRPLDG